MIKVFLVQDLRERPGSWMVRQQKKLTQFNTQGVNFSRNTHIPNFILFSPYLINVFLEIPLIVVPACGHHCFPDAH